MSLTLTTLPNLSPVYTDELTLTATESTADSTFYYKFQVYVETVLIDTFIYFADPVTFDAEINLSPILSTYFESSVYIPTGTTLQEAVPNSIVTYYITATSYDADNQLINTTDTSNVEIFNGCFNTQDYQSIGDYIMSTGSTGNFLTNWDTNRDIMLDDIGYVSVFTGDFGASGVSNYGGIEITRYQLDGTSTGITDTYSNTDKNIVQIDVSPSGINLVSTNFINSLTKYYVINEINGLNTTPMKINLVKENKLTKYYNFNYYNRLGGLDFFTASKVSNDSYGISKELLDKFNTQKVYYTDVDEEITVLTQPLTSAQANGLKELFMSPAVTLWFNDKYNDIRITNNRMIVNDRYPKISLIQIAITFKYNYKYHSQQY